MKTGRVGQERQKKTALGARHLLDSGYFMDPARLTKFFFAEIAEKARGAKKGSVAQESVWLQSTLAPIIAKLRPWNLKSTARNGATTQS